MFKFFAFSLVLLFSIPFDSTAQKSLEIKPGVSEQLALRRSELISNVRYELHFTIPPQLNAAISGEEQLSFILKDHVEDLQIDFKQPSTHVKMLKVNDEQVTVQLVNEHLIIAAKYLVKGKNEIEISFIAGNESLNRNNEYLYALFVPDHARNTFPCFDQPNLKARFNLSLTVPEGWKALANGRLKSSSSGSGNTRYDFLQTDILPTYLFSFTAGKYTALEKNIKKYNYAFLHRETDSLKIKLSVDSIFKAHSDAISFLENWTAIPFPFQKIGFVAVPDFQFGGMEHPGEVQYKASSLFLDEGATKDQFISRSNLISHETAHMWFGDLVTMKWFNDVWMKEVFANFMADKVTEKLMGKATFDLKFLQDHYPAAYGVDRTLGANPIRQQLDNLQDAGSMYGNIIYHKAPIMMRQLELLMGKDKFQQGIRTYLKKYAYRNATWNDLIKILGMYTSENLEAWNRVWVNTAGRPVFDYGISFKNNQIDQLKVMQHAEVGANAVWPQVFSITLFYPDGKKQIAINMNHPEVEVKEAKGLGKPLYILFNSDAMGYGLFPLDPNSAKRFSDLKNPLERASAYINAYENMLAGRNVKPAELLELFAENIKQEKDEMNLRLLGGYISGIYWSFLKPVQRLEKSPELESVLWETMQSTPLSNNKKALFGTYQSVYMSKDGGMKLDEIWKTQKGPTGIKLTEDDFTGIAFTLALKSDTVSSYLKIQRDRITNQERKNRISFLMPALSTDVKERDSFFASLSERKNRQKEAWVGSALTYLNHPLRQSTSIKYLPKSLEILEEIKNTGDIFFPQSWLGAIFSSYQSKEAYQIVTDFLKKYPDYNPKLKGKILQATDHLYRSQKIVPDK
ncbi:M1 family aminopeptidase [Pedobacter frigidisoli]|uniref:M1 family aminopeptidase n=1 Tax=Pedobacter frigidisoli TaxID=2530455 RepID=UPI002931B7F6|nr:M1 family aminopeptidase [Pedobacter frigidisoli]